MSDYTRANTGGATHFGDKDSLTSGDSDKVIVGAQFDTEFNAIVTAVASKYDSDNIGTIAQAEAGTSNSVLMTPLRTQNWGDANAGIVGDLQALTDPNVDTILGWDDSASAAINFSIGTGLTSTAGGAIELDQLGIEDLVDPNADRIIFWDDTAGATAWLTAGTGLGISGTVLSTNDSAIVHDSLSGFVANEHIDHSAVSITAGTGLSGGGTIDATRTVNLDISGLTTIEGNALSPSNDSFLVSDAGTMKRITYKAAGCRVVTNGSTSDTATDDHLNSFRRYTSASAVTFTLNTGIGIVGSWICIEQAAAGQVTIAGTATVNGAVGQKTRAQNSVIVLMCVATNTWTVYGDTAA